MARTVPSSISSLVGVAATRNPVWLVKLEFSGGTQYYSSQSAITYGGNTYVANRIHSISTFEAAYIDRKTNNGIKVSIEIDNLADDGSATFPVTALNASFSFEDAKVTVYGYSPDASDAVLMLWGYCAGVSFDGSGKYATIAATFFWDSLDSLAPAKMLAAKGFASQEAAAKTGENQDDQSLPVPLIYGAGAMRVWPIIYNHWSDGFNFHVEFVLSGTQSGQPFNAADVVASDFKLFGATPATTIEFYTGSQSSPPANLTRFPENNAHTLCAFGYAVFPITAQIKDKLDNVQAQDIRALIQNGRPLVDTSLPSENAPLILRDYLRDPVYGMGLASAAFDTTALTTTSNYVGTRYQVRYELSKQMAGPALVQYILTDFHGFITFDDGKIQIRCKKNSESSIATFATIDSGHSARKIHNDFVDVTIKDSSELINQQTIKYRRKTKNRRIVTLYDPTAQARAGGTALKVVDDTIDEWDAGGIYDETQAQVLAAIIVREEQNGNLFIKFDVSIWDGLIVSPGDIITVYSPDIINNGSNNLFRVTKQSIDSDGDFLIHFEAQIYKTAIYNDDVSGLGVDLLRGGEDTNAQGRPPDVVPVSLSIIDIVANDTEGPKVATMRAVFTVPAYDPTADVVAGVFLENKVSEVEIDWHYTDEAIQQARSGNSKKIVQQATALQDQIDFDVPYYKSRSVEAFFVSIGPNRARVPLGLIPDPTKVTTLTSNLSATGATAAVAATGGNFNANDYCQIEKEQLQVLNKAATAITFANVASVRTPQFGTASIGHPSGTEIAVLKQSYPSLIKSLLVPRFTYPTIVQGAALQRGGDGVRAVWTDANPDNLEEYLVYWSTDADAGTNANKLGGTNPAWYTADPFTPGAGVTLSRTNKQHHYIIPQEQIGPTGTAVFIRIAARNGKQNFSAALSNLQNSSTTASGTTAPPTDAPSTPALIDIVYNGPAVGATDMATVNLRIWADATHTKTFAQTGTNELVSILFDAHGFAFKPSYTIELNTQLSINMPFNYQLGAVLNWASNRAWNAGGHIDSPSVSIPIACGGFGTNVAGITGLAVSNVTAIDEKHSYLSFAFTQPSTPIAIAYALILEQLAGEVAFSRELKYEIFNEASYLVAGVQSVTNLKVKHPKKTAVQYKVRLVGIDGTTLDSAVFNSTSPDLDTGPPNNGTAIVINRAKIKKGAKLNIDWVLPTLQMASHTKNVLIIHDNNFLGTGRRFYDPNTSTWVLTYPDGTTEINLIKGSGTGTPLSPPELFSGGRTTIYVRIGVYNAFNGSSVTYSGDLTTTLTAAGSDADNATGDTAVASGLAAPFVDENYGELHVTCLKPSTNAATIKQYQVVMSTQATAPAGAPTVGLEGVVKIHPLGTPFRNKQGASTTLYFYFRVENDFGFSGWSAGVSVTGTTISRPLDDFIGTGVPALTMGLERNNTSVGSNTLTTFTLDAGAVQTLNYYVGMVLHIPSLAAVDRVRNITASSFAAGIITVTVDTPFSIAPAGTPIFEIHFGLTLAGKLGTGSTTSLVILPAAASAVDSFYNGMMLYLVTAAAQQQLQRIIGYVGATRTATIEAIETALGAAPASGAGFMLSQMSFGYAASNGTGIIASAQIKLWYNSESSSTTASVFKNVGEPLMPSGENAFSLSSFEWEDIRRSNGVKRAGDEKAIAPIMTFDFPALGYTPMVRGRFRNAYRQSGSDGRSAWTYYVPGFLSTAPPTTVYLPGTFIPPFVDPQAFINRPKSLYSVY